MIIIVLYIYQHNGAVRKTNEDLFVGGILNSHWLRSGAGQTCSPLIGRWCPAPRPPALGAVILVSPRFASRRAPSLILIRNLRILYSE